MAITNNDVKLLLYCKTLGVDFRSLLTLGRLRFYGTVENINRQAQKYNYNAPANFQFTDGYSEPLFHFLGAETIDSMDYSNYENATLLHDLNKNVNEELHNKYTVVIDSGTIEHVFNFPVAIANCMNMLKVGGYFIGITPANNLLGHGFYQFSHELYYRIFSPENGFETVKVMITSMDEGGEASEWYEILDPEKVKERIVFSNDSPVYIMVIAKKIEDVEVFSKMPLQSDYQATWQKLSHDEPDGSMLKKIYRKTMPKKLRGLLYLIKKELFTTTIKSKTLGELNIRHFRKVE